jgi:hypothetical protein
MQVAQGAFESIKSGRMVASVALAGAPSALEVPLADEGTDEWMALAKECVPRNRQVIGAIERTIHEQETRIPALEDELARAVAAEGGPGKTRADAEMEVKRLSALTSLVGWGAVAGLVGVLATQSPIALGVTVVGAATWTWLKDKTRLAARRQRGGINHFKITTARILAEAQLESAKSVLEAARAARTKAEALQRPLETGFREAEMRRFVEGTVPDPDAKVELAEQFVTIGGLKVPRKTAVDSSLPAESEAPHRDAP